MKKIIDLLKTMNADDLEKIYHFVKGYVEAKEGKHDKTRQRQV